MTKYGFYHDAENCIGCHTCQVACKDTNRLKVGENYRNVKTYCGGQGWDLFLYHTSVSCAHCDEPACAAACPNGAVVKREDGLVVVDKAKCRGCGTCIPACPYGSIAMIADEGFVDKCDGCIELRSQGELPACMASCPQRAIEFGDIDELKAAHADEELVCEVAALPKAATKPNLLIHAKPCMLDEDFEPYKI